MHPRSNKLSDLNEQVSFSYYPNRRNLFVVPALVIGCIWGFWACGKIILNSETILFKHLIKIAFFLLISVCCIICSKIFYDTAQQVLCCTEEGCYFLNDRQVELDFVSWQDIRYAYETKNFKGHFYLVLSKKQLTQKETHRLATKSSWLLNLYVDQAIVIWDNATPSAQIFFSEVKKHLNVVEHFRYSS